jgi:putative sterol carrier protein
VAFRYLSKEWLADGRKRVESSTEFPTAAKGLTASLLNVITEAPGAKTVYLYYSFKDGKVADLAVGPDAAIAKKPHEFQATGTYETYALINQGKLSSTQAVFQRKVKLEGNLAKALRYVKPLEVFNGILRTVPTEY